MSRFTIRGTLLVFCACLPFLCAVFASAVGVRPQPMAEGPKRASLAFDQYMVDLEQAPFKRGVPGRFGFTNRGDTPITITDLVPSCGCLTPKLPKRVYQPGEFGVIVLKVQSANQPNGVKEYSLGVKYDDGKPREATLVMRVEFPEDRLIVRPMSMAFYQLGSVTPTTQEIIVSDRSSKGIEIKGASSSSDLAQIELVESDKVDVDEEGFPQHRLRVTVRNVPPGQHGSVITIFTNDPKHLEIKVPLRIYGKTSGDLVMPVSAKRKSFR